VKKIVVLLKDGIGSRILAIGFSLALAKKMDREIEFLWYQNWQCGNDSRIEDFFRGELCSMTRISEVEDSAALREAFGERMIRVNRNIPERLSLLELDKYEIICLENAERRKTGNLTECRELKQLAESEIRNLKLSKQLNDKMERFSDKTFKGKVLGVHVRGGDIRKLAEGNEIESKSAEANRYIPVERFIEKLKEIHNEYDTIFLSAEDEDHLETIKELFQDKIVCRSKPHGRESVEHIHEALIEIYLLSKCDFLLLGKSKFSKLAVHLGGVPFESLGNIESARMKSRLLSVIFPWMRKATK
jgi:hypothetical protein